MRSYRAPPSFTGEGLTKGLHPSGLLSPETIPESTFLLTMLPVFDTLSEARELRLKLTRDDLRELVQHQADFIISQQLPSGAIPWYQGAITDPWDHVECAIALDLAGRFDEAVKAYRWSRDTQNPDGSWYSSYPQVKQDDQTKDANFAAYIATGMWFHYLATKDTGLLRKMWPMVEKAIDFALSLQQPTGEIYWAMSPAGKTWPGAILTSSSCIWHSIRNGLSIGKSLGIDNPDWEKASNKLLSAMREHPELFDRMGENKRRYAMNWFYPVLTGVLKGKEAKQRIDREWNDFIIENWGCRVAVDEDTTAVAETSELILALALIDEHERARMLLDWTLKLRDEKPGFCRGIKFPEKLACPPDEERATWTSAALILAIASLSKV
jgi:tetratricopeptide (TPR) repeat protein